MKLSAWKVSRIVKLVLIHRGESYRSSNRVVTKLIARQVSPWPSLLAYFEVVSRMKGSDWIARVCWTWWNRVPMFGHRGVESCWCAQTSLSFLIAADVAIFLVAATHIVHVLEHERLHQNEKLHQMLHHPFLENASRADLEWPSLMQ